MDYALFRLINGLAGRWAILDAFMRLVVNDYFVPTSMALILVMMWFWGRDEAERSRYQRIAILAAASLITANIILKVCNLIYFRPRPFDAHQVNLLFYRPWDSSFPSNPATVGFSMAMAVLFQDLTWGIPMLVLAILFSFARIFCGVHYPSDVLAGAILGSAVAWGFVRLTPKLEKAIGFVRHLAKRLYLG